MLTSVKAELQVPQPPELEARAEVILQTTDCVLATDYFADLGEAAARCGASYFAKPAQLA